MEYLKESLDSFFNGEARVAVLKGTWGVGKTYFWDGYINDKIKQKSISQIAYSYISLFGKNSLADVKKSLFHSAKAIAADKMIEDEFKKELDANSTMLDRVPWLKDGVNNVRSKTSWLRHITKHAQDLPLTGRYTGIINTFEYALVNNYVVCLDDLERKGKSLSVKEVMGLIDELSIRKNCKVILIFNEDSLDDETDKREFEAYREKVVDVELHHKPTCLENLKLVFDESFKQFSVVHDVVNELDIKNIRVLNKIKWMISQFDSHICAISDSRREQFLVHAILLSWGYYLRDQEISYQELKNQLVNNSWMSYLSDKDTKPSAGEIRFRGLASNLKLSRSEFDEQIIHFLEHGFIEEARLKETVSNLLDLQQAEIVSSKFRDAWDIYSKSFSDNLTDFISQLSTILDNNLDNVALTDFSAAIDILSEFGVDISKHIDRYINLNSEDFNKIDSFYMERIKNEELINAINKIRDGPKEHDIDEITKIIAENSSWNSDHIEFLSSLDERDFYSWMKSSPDDLVKKIRGGLLIFHNLKTKNEVEQDKFKTISSNVIGALKIIAKENEFNTKRVKYIYGIE